MATEPPISAPPTKFDSLIERLKKEKRILETDPVHGMYTKKIKERGQDVKGDVERVLLLRNNGFKMHRNKIINEKLYKELLENGGHCEKWTYARVVGKKDYVARPSKTISKAESERDADWAFARREEAKKVAAAAAAAKLTPF